MSSTLNSTGLGNPEGFFEPYTTLEYLVAPVPGPEPTVQHATGVADSGQRSDIMQSMQALTNLVYLLSRDSGGDEQRRTTLTLLQAEVARLNVLLRTIVQPAKL